MVEPGDDAELPQAMVMAPRRRRLSIVWIIPILAAVVAIGIAVQRVRSEGPTITIIFDAAQGIEAGKTFIKYKDVNIGQVRAVQLTEDFSKVEVTAKITKRAAEKAGAKYDAKTGEAVTHWTDAHGKETKERGRYDYTYISTAGFGHTIFWQYTDDFLEATGNKPHN